jgi:hypothetical protein
VTISGVSFDVAVDFLDSKHPRVIGSKLPKIKGLEPYYVPSCKFAFEMNTEVTIPNSTRQCVWLR